MDIQSTNNIQEIDGLLIDVDSGEVVGYVAEDGGHLKAPTADAPITEGMANWVLKKMVSRRAQLQVAESAGMDATNQRETMVNAALAALERDPEFVAAGMILDQCGKIIKRAKGEYAWFETAFGSALREYAKVETVGKKSNTWSSPFGSVQVILPTPKVEIVDEEKFIKWALVNCPEAVKMTAMISKVPKNVPLIKDIPAEDGDEFVPGNGLRMSIPIESQKIVAGAK